MADEMTLPCPHNHVLCMGEVPCTGQFKCKTCGKVWDDFAGYQKEEKVSWAAHDPEGFDNVCVKGVVRWLDNKIKGDLSKDQHESLREIVDHIAENHRPLFSRLTFSARTFVDDEESDYLMSLGDAVKDRLKYGE